VASGDFLHRHAAVFPYTEDDAMGEGEAGSDIGRNNRKGRHPDNLVCGFPHASPLLMPLSGPAPGRTLY
jgi:hypothetical protein